MVYPIYTHSKKMKFSLELLKKSKKTPFIKENEDINMLRLIICKLGAL